MEQAWSLTTTLLEENFNTSREDSNSSFSSEPEENIENILRNEAAQAKMGYHTLEILKKNPS